MTEHQPTGAKQRKRDWAAALAAGCLAVAAAGCVVSPPLRAVKEPRAGRALGDRVAVVYSQRYQISIGGLEKLHPFDIHKYEKVYLRLVADGLLRPEDVFVPPPVTEEQVLRVHTRAYLDSLGDPRQVARYLEAPIVAKAPAGVVDAAVLNAFRHATGGTVLAARLALQHGIAVNLAGGYHHAEPGVGGGFCVYADMPIAIRALRAEGLARRVLVVDLDVHQGNGTAVCLAGDDSVFTFDMHEGDIYPFPKARCSLDLELAAGTGDAEYLRILRERLPAELDAFRPDLVFLQAGCDVLAGDPLAALELTEAGVVTRDAFVIDECVRRHVPVAMVLGGGYSPSAWHAQYLSVARTIRTYGRA